jgi:TDG/mug DNA glycosylase family protein
VKLTAGHADAEQLARLAIGAGFSRRGERLRTLPDFVGPGMRVLVCGLNPSLYAADAGIPFARPGNRFWPAALAADMVHVERDPWRALADDRVGFTDLVKRATVAAQELRPDEYRAGSDRVRSLVEWLQPTAVCFVGLAGFRAAINRHAQPGRQPDGFGGAATYVMPSTSGLNAHATLATLTQNLREALALAG